MFSLGNGVDGLDSTPNIIGTSVVEDPLFEYGELEPGTPVNNPGF